MAGITGRWLVQQVERIAVYIGLRCYLMTLLALGSMLRIYLKSFESHKAVRSDPGVAFNGTKIVPEIIWLCSATF